MKLLPIVLNIENKRCLIVGGGTVARRKTEGLLECGAQVHIVAPQLCNEFGTLVSRLEYSERVYQSGDCENFQLVFACTDNRKVNAAIADEAQRLNIWCNVADDSPRSDFHTAAAVRRGDICVGITTSGSSPALSRHLKSKVQETIGPEYSELLEIMSSRRAMLQENITEQNQRAAVWRDILQSEVLELLKSGQREAAEAVVDGLCNPSREK